MSFIYRIKNSKVLTNMSWLFVMNFFNTIIPYLTFPYISRILMPSGFGIVAFSLAFIGYFLTVIDYGFNLTGARKIAIVDSNKQLISKIYTTIIVTKLILFIASVPVIIILTLTINSLYEIKSFIFILIITAFSYVIIPIWLYQGLQKMKYITLISFSIRTIFVISVFTLINTPKDAELYILLYSLAFFFIGTTSLIFVNKKLGIKFCKFKFRDIVETLKEGYHVFTSAAVISIMGSTGTFVLGLFHSPITTGYYSGISKINIVITKLFYPVGQAFFPYNSKKYAESFITGYLSVLKISKIIIPIFTSLIVLIIVFRKSIVSIALGEHYVASANLLIILAFLPLLSIMSNLMGTQVLVASGHNKEYSKAFLRGAIISIVLFIVLGYFFSLWGVAIAALLGALFNLLFLFIEIRSIINSHKKKEII